MLKTSFYYLRGIKILPYINIEKGLLVTHAAQYIIQSIGWPLIPLSQRAIINCIKASVYRQFGNLIIRYVPDQLIARMPIFQSNLAVTCAFARQYCDIIFLNTIAVRIIQRVYPHLVISYGRSHIALPSQPGKMRSKIKRSSAYAFLTVKHIK